MPHPSRARSAAGHIARYLFWVAVIGGTLVVYLLGGNPTSFRYVGF